MEIADKEDVLRIERKQEQIFEKLHSLQFQLSNYEVPREYLLTKKRVMELIGTNDKYLVDKLVTEGKIRKISLSDRAVRYPWEDIKKLVS